MRQLVEETASRDEQTDRSHVLDGGDIIQRTGIFSSLLNGVADLDQLVSARPAPPRIRRFRMRGPHRRAQIQSGTRRTIQAAGSFVDARVIAVVVSLVGKEDSILGTLSPRPGIYR